jgi:hypothetical protein
VTPAGSHRRSCFGRARNAHAIIHRQRLRTLPVANAISRNSRRLEGRSDLQGVSSQLFDLPSLVPPGRLAGQKVHHNSSAVNLCSTAGIHLLESKTECDTSLVRRCHKSVISIRCRPIIIRGHRHRGCSANLRQDAPRPPWLAQGCQGRPTHLRAKGDWSGVETWEAVAAELAPPNERDPGDGGP